MALAYAPRFFSRDATLTASGAIIPNLAIPTRKSVSTPATVSGVGDYVEICPVYACRLENPWRLDREKCTRCGDCAATCPSKALRLLGRFYPVAELLEILWRDHMFYQVSGGGVTLSGRGSPPSTQITVPPS